MATTTTSKQIDLLQLSTELGGASLWANAFGGQTTINAPTVTQTALDAAVTAHVAVDRVANEATLRQQAQSALAANRSFIGIASPTNAQNAAQIKALTRQMNGLIRFTLSDFAGTD